MFQQQQQQDLDDLRIVRQIFEGNLNDLPQIASKIVRIFTSSTFTDTSFERNSLMENVYPKLKDYCREKYGLEFQVVDMRWGVRDEATDDHKTTELCMQEIDNCQRLSLGPNFVVFLGQKYGYRPLPTKVLENEFKAILDALKSYPEDVNLLETWYKLDLNSLPSVFILQPVSSIFKNFTNKNEKNLMEEDQNKWWKTMGQLCVCIRKGAKILYDTKKFNQIDNHRYNWSVTEQEVVRGILDANNNTQHTLCFIREIKNINTHLIQYASRFIDMNYSTRKVDEEAQIMLNELRDIKVPNKLQSTNIVKYDIEWIDDEGISLREHNKYLDEFSQTFYARIIDLIEKAILKQKIYPHNKLNNEVLQHLHFCKNFTRLFQGRNDVLEEIKRYIYDDTRTQPFVIYGLPGSGKTSILAKTFINIKEWLIDKQVKPILLIRFLGTTPDSSSIYPLFKSVCSQLSFIFNQSFDAIPEDLSQLTNYFKRLLNMATSERPLYIIFDSLDQLSSSNSAHSVSWLPISLPKHVKIIVSTLNESYGILNNLQVMIEKQENFVEIKALGQDLGLNVLNVLLKNINRTISDDQWPLVKQALEKCNTPLYVKLVFDKISLWKSYTLDTTIPDSIDECISILFDRIENQHGKILVEHSLAYITASKNGLSEAELEDLISLDEVVLNDIYQYHLPPIRRIPPLLWTRIRNDLQSYLSEREADGISVVYWYHKQFIDVSTKRFLNLNDFKLYIHSQIADYFMGIWSNKAKPFEYTQEQVKMFMLKSIHGEADRKVPAQPNVFSSDSNLKRFNCRKLSELPYHLIRSNRISELFTQVLFNYKFLNAKLSCMPLNSVIADYEDYLSIYGYNEEVALVSDALRLSSSMLIQNSTNLAPQLIGRLLYYRLLTTAKYTHVKSLIEQCEQDGLSECSLVPAYNCFHMPGGPLVFSLEAHPFAVYGLYLINDSLQLVSMSNRFIIFDLTSGEIVRQIVPQIEGIMQMMNVSPNRKFCVSLSTNDKIIYWRMTSNEIKILTRVQLGDMKKIRKKHRNDPLTGCFSAKEHFVVWSKYTYFIYSAIDLKLIKQERVEYPLVQIELMPHELGIELEIIQRTEDCADDEEKNRDYMKIEYSLIPLQNKTLHNEYKPHALRFDFHSAIVLTKDKTRFYTCIELADNCVECYRNKYENQFNKEKSQKIWKYHKSLEDNYDRVLSLILSNDEKYLLAALIWGLKVYFILTGQSKPLYLPKNIKIVQIGLKKLNFPALFTKDNQYVVAGIRNSIYIWDCSYGNLLKTLDAHYGRITCLISFNTDIKDLVISSSMDKTIKIWNMKSILEKESQIDKLDKPIENIYLSTEASLALAQSRNQLALISLKNGKIIKMLHNDKYGSLFSCCCLTSRGDFAASAESNKLIIWEIETYNNSKVTYASDAFPSNFTIKQLIFFNSEVNILLGLIDNNTKQISIMNYTIPDGDLVYKIDYSIKTFADYKDFVVSSDDTYLAFYRNDKKTDLIAVFNAELGTHVHNIKLQYTDYNSVFNIVALHSNPNHIALIDSEKGSLINIRDKKFIRSVAKWNGKSTKDGKYGLYSPSRGGLEIIDLKTGSKIKTLIPKIAEGVFDIETILTQDDQFVIYYHSGRRTIRVFRFNDAIEIANFKCQAKVKCLRACQDGKAVIVGCEDGSISLYLIVDSISNECKDYLNEWRNEQMINLNESITEHQNDEEQEQHE